MADKRIRSKSSLITKNITLLLNLFIEKESLSVSDIQKALGTEKRQTVYNYINRLQDMGYTFSKNIHNRYTYYSLTNKDATSYEPLTLNTLRKYTILKKLQNKPASRQDTLEDVTLDIQESQSYKLFDELIKEGEICKSTDGTCFQLTGKTFMPTMRVDSNELDSLHSQLPHLPSTTPHASQYQSLYKKVATYYNEPDADSPTDNYICYGRFPQAFSKETQHIFDQLKDADFPHNVLKLTYISRGGSPCTKTLAIGLIVHVLEKDQFYLIGKNINNPKENSIIPMENIKHIEQTNMENEYYLSKEFKDLFDSMFSISANPPEKVKVAFDDWGNIKDKITALCKQCPHATLQIEKHAFTDADCNTSNSNSKENVRQQFIYTDSIRGRNDFINYLRQFGKAVHVLEPPELRSHLQDSAKNTLKNYKRSNDE